MNTPLSPKVLWGTVSGLLAAAALSFLQALAGNHEFLDALPPWAKMLVTAAIPVAIAALAAYLKRDHLRDVGQAQVTDTNVPAAVNAPDVDGDGFDDDQPLGERPAL